MSAKFVIIKTKQGAFRFIIKAGNGEILTTSEGYASKAGCKSGIEAVRKNVPKAVVVDETE